MIDKWYSRWKRFVVEEVRLSKWPIFDAQILGITCLKQGQFQVR